MVPKITSEEFSCIYEENRHSILRMCYMYLKDESLAQDAAQETFIKAYLKLETFKGKASINTWLSSIAINVCKNILRKQKAAQIISIDSVAEQASAKNSADEEHICVSAAVKNLPVQLKTVILLKYYRNLKIKEISRILKIPQTTVNYRLLKAKEILKDTLKEDIDYD